MADPLLHKHAVVIGAAAIGRQEKIDVIVEAHRNVDGGTHCNAEEAVKELHGIFEKLIADGRISATRTKDGQLQLRRANRES